MDFILDSTLTPLCAFDKLRDNPIVDTLKYHFSKGNSLVEVDSDLGITNGSSYHYTKGFMDVLSNAYSMHLPIALDSQDLWYIVLCELASYIKGNTETLRSLFTKEPVKGDIVVSSEVPWILPLQSVMEKLKASIPIDMSLFVPNLSTQTPYGLLAMQGAFCDAVQHYYDYTTYCCGIPKVRVLGTIDDWILLRLISCQLQETFTKVTSDLKIQKYLTNISLVFNNIASALQCGADGRLGYATSFWKDIFMQKNIGSGAQLEISGWITKLFFPRELSTLENFTASFSEVPFTNLESGRKFKSIYGAFTYQEVEGFLEMRYGFMTFEVLPKENKPHSPA